MKKLTSTTGGKQWTQIKDDSIWQIQKEKAVT